MKRFLTAAEQRDRALFWHQAADTPADPQLQSYLDQAQRNLMATSRTAQGVIDTSASPDKAEQMHDISGDQAANLAVQNYRDVIARAYAERNRQFGSPQEVRDFVEGMAAQVNGGILKGPLLRQHDSDKYPYTRVKDLPAAADDFYAQLHQKLNDPAADPIDTAAWAEYMINPGHHFFGDGAGKALALTTPLATPTGWTTMEKIAVGDQVFDEQGRPTTVTGVYDVSPRTSYDVIFSDGASLRACGEHLWTTVTYAERKRWQRTKTRIIPEDWAVGGTTMTTEALRETLRVTHGVTTKANHSIPQAAPLCLPEADLPVHPWILGYWLGNGTAENGSVTCAVSDEEEIKALIVKAGYEVCPARHIKPSGNGVTFTIRGLRGDLARLGVLNDKHIPQVYLRASEEQRRQLAAGLLDSDGHQDKNGKSEFAAKGREFIEQVSELFISLGQRPVLSGKQAHIGSVNYGVHYRLYFAPTCSLFSLPRKASRFRSMEETKQATRRQQRMIVDIRPVDNEPMRCIEVDSPSHLYLAGRAMIPTHNSSKALSSYILMRNGLPLPTYPGGNKEYFRNTTRRLPIGQDPQNDAESFDTFLRYYRSMMPGQQRTSRRRTAAIYDYLHFLGGQT